MLELCASRSVVGNVLLQSLKQLPEKVAWNGLVNSKSGIVQTTRVRGPPLARSTEDLDLVYKSFDGLALAVEVITQSLNREIHLRRKCQQPA